MFKKSIEAKSLQKLSGSDKKKFRRTVRGKFPRLDDADLDVLLPPKAEITVSKLQTRVTLYTIDDEFPLFIDVDGRGSEIFPTVFALWKVPEMLPCFSLKGAEVSRYVIGGADLMFPGVHVPPSGLATFSAGEVWAIKVPGNPFPIAVGSTIVSSADAIKAGLRGKALRIIHYYRDMLWESCQGRYVPNEGFLEDIVREDPQLNLVIEIPEDFNCQVADDHDNDSQSLENMVADGTTVDIAEEVKGLELEGVAGDESNAEEPQTISTEDVDRYLNNCLLQALHTTVMDNDLPLAGSTLWSNHVLPCRPPGVTLDLKRSSFKKLSKWLQAKSADGLVSIKEDKHKKETNLVSINRSHPDFVSFKVERRKAAQEPDQTDAINHYEAVLEVIEVYKSSVHVNPIFARVGADTGKLYTAAEASDVVFEYVELENLVSPSDKALVVLDPKLCDSLYKGAIKKGSAYPSMIHKRDLGAAFMSRMHPNHIVTRGSDSVVRKGCIKPVQIMTERRQGNKKVTKVSGLEIFLVDVEALASELQKKFACSTSVAELPVAGKKSFQVLIQGGVVEDVGRYLAEHYGIPKRYIEILDKTRK